MKVIIINGPPGSGKDALVNYCYMAQEVNDLPQYIVAEKFANPMRKAVQALFSLTDEELTQIAEDQVLKVTPSPLLFGKSFRETLILLSEKFIKVFWGKEFFGHSLVKRIKMETMDNVYIISDGGFNEEVAPLIREYGADNITVIKLQRNGHNFATDSRNYIDCKALNIREIWLTNSNLDNFLKIGFSIISSLIKDTYDAKSEQHKSIISK